MVSNLSPGSDYKLEQSRTIQNRAASIATSFSFKLFLALYQVDPSFRSCYLISEEACKEMLEDKMSFLGAGAGLLVLWLTATAVYRLFFHPLAKFPGPRLAAITTWYEGYYDVFLKGKFTFQFGRLHKKYGEFLGVFFASPYSLRQRGREESSSMPFLVMSLR